MRVAYRFLTLSSQRRNEDSLVRNTCVSAAVITSPKTTRNMAANFLSRGYKVRCQALLKGVTSMMSDYRALLLCLAWMIYSHRMDSSTSSYSVLLSRFILAITLFMSRWCSIED